MERTIASPGPAPPAGTGAAGAVVPAPRTVATISWRCRSPQKPTAKRARADRWRARTGTTAHLRSFAAGEPHRPGAHDRHDGAAVRMRPGEIGRVTAPAAGRAQEKTGSGNEKILNDRPLS